MIKSRLRAEKTGKKQIKSRLRANRADEGQKESRLIAEQMQIRKRAE